IGRVWRLGQKRDVEAYTIFMDNIADSVALNIMYAKLMNLKKAELKPRAITGEEILLYSESGEIFKAPPQVVFKEKMGRKVFKKVTEYKAIQVFIKDGEKGLESLVNRILLARQEVEKELKSKGILFMPKKKDDIERVLKALGFSSSSMLMESFKSLVRSSAPILDIRVEEVEGGTLKVTRGSEMPVTLKTLDDIFGVFRGKETMGTVVSYGQDADKLLLANLSVRYDGVELYREPIGFYLKSGKILRGEDLLREISEALSRCIGTPEKVDLFLPTNLKASINSKFRNTISGVLAPLNTYRDMLTRDGFRDHDNWPDEHKFSLSTELFGGIIFVKELSKVGPVHEDVKREVEEEAIKFVLKFEADKGRKATTVPEREHFDIISIDPKSNEVRKIEVKGHAGAEIYGELTEDEAKLAKKEGDNYWLYIVYDIKSGSPGLLMFRDPLKTMKWETFERVERRYILRPKENA
ncbi:MAG: DUF3883 domain-containing protein, partial [Candidatus Korarchaeota archaeon]